MKPLVLIGMLGVFLRWTPAAFLTAWWQFIPLQLLHALTFGALYVGAVTFMDMASSGGGLRSSAQALYGMVAIQVSRAVGAPLSGEICERLGYARLYLVSGMVGLAACAVMLFFVRGPDHHEGAEGPPPRPGSPSNGPGAA